MRNPALTVHCTLSLLTLIGTANFAAADDLFVASSNTVVARVKAEGGNFQMLSACFGAPHASAFDGSNLFLSDNTGNVYKFNSSTGQTTSFATLPCDATGLATHANEILVGGTASGTILRVSKSTGAVIGTLTVEHNVTAMTIAGSRLFVGANTGAITGIDLLGGPPTFLGTCSGAIASMAADATHVIVGTNSGWIFRMNMATGMTEGAFVVDSDCTAVATHGGSILVGGSNGRILRVHRITGAPQGSMQWSSDITAMSAARTDPGQALGLGTACPCQNTDPIGGCKNSTWVGAYLGGSGSASISADDLTLSAFNLPPNSFGRIFMGTSMNGISFGDGLLCVSPGAALVRYPVAGIGAEGRLTLGPGLQAYAASNFGPGAQISAGSTWTFQAHFRDVFGQCGTGFNTTNALRVSFVP